MSTKHIEQHFSGRSPALIIVMDGWGLGSGGDEDAVSHANTPVIDRLWKTYPHTQLMTHGAYVGLPSGKDLGGSEVGHLTMGAGLILDQGPTRINKAIKDGSFFASDALKDVIAKGLKGGCIHLFGLLSDGNIHSHITHFRAVIDHAFESGVRRLRVHGLLDGRDVAIQSAQKYIAMLEELFVFINSHEGFDYAFASGGGRERIIMDRDYDWSKVEAGWNLMVNGQGEHRFTSMQAAVDHFRGQNPDMVDQDMPGFVIVDADNEAIGPVHDGDAVVMMNFRGDRAVEISEAFELEEFDGFARGGKNGRGPDVLYAGMMVYDEDRNLPARQLMGPTKVSNPLGRRLVEMGIRQFRLTETQKYPHVTFFFNGGYREPLDREMEDYILIPSDKGISFADVPGMKAAEIADKAVQLIASGGYGFGLINFANADMVGHCGRLEPAIAAVEAVDTAVGRIVDALQAVGGSALITADHGNAEEMRVHNAEGKDEPCTRHSINPVPCILFDAEFDQTYALRQASDGDDVCTTPGLSHIAATVLNMLGHQAPEELQPSLIVEKGVQ